MAASLTKSAIEKRVIAALPGADEGVVATVRGLAEATNLPREQVCAAISSLRFRGMVDFKQLVLSPSMTAARQARADAALADQSQAKADGEAGADSASDAPVESVSRGADARSSAATSEPMDVTVGETTQLSGAGGSGSSITEPAASAASAIDGAPLPVSPSDTAPAGAGSVACPLPDPAPMATSVRVHRSGALSPEEVDRFISQVGDWLDRTGVPASLMGELAIRHPGFWNLLIMRRTARRETSERVLAFIAAWPDGVTREQFADAELASSSVAQQVAREVEESAERRRLARRNGGGVGVHLSKVETAGASTPTAHAFQRALIEQPEHALLFLRRRWPGVLDRVCAAARADDCRPAAMLVELIERGLSSHAELLS